MSRLTTRLLAPAALLLPLLANADTLTMKNGNRFVGNFTSANATQISFTESNGNRQMLNLYDVQELRFGNDSAQPLGNGYGRNTPTDLSNQPNRNQAPANGYPAGVQPSASSASSDDLDRLVSDLDSAMNNNDLSDQRRRSLQDSTSVLREASQQVRNNRPINQRSVRLALDSIRDVTNSFQPRDRELLNEDIRRTEQLVNAPQRNGGRDY